LVRSPAHRLRASPRRERSLDPRASYQHPLFTTCAAPAPAAAAAPPALPGLGPVPSHWPGDPKLGLYRWDQSLPKLHRGLGTPLIPSAMARPPTPPTAAPPRTDPTSYASPAQLLDLIWPITS